MPDESIQDDAFATHRAQFTLRAVLVLIAIAAWLSLCVAWTIHGPHGQRGVAAFGLLITGIVCGIYSTQRLKAGTIAGSIIGGALGGGLGLGAWGAIWGTMIGYWPPPPPPGTRWMWENSGMQPAVYMGVALGVVGLVVGAIVGLLYGISVWDMRRRSLPSKK